MTIIPILLFIFVFIFILGVLIYNIVMNNRIKNEGFEAQAIVSRIDINVTETIHEGSNITDTDTTKTYYVKYKDQFDNEYEAKLNNPSWNLKEGDNITIKYLPEKPEVVVKIK